jgi:endonuclease YncB( thermonuclease family)
MIGKFFVFVSFFVLFSITAFAKDLQEIPASIDTKVVKVQDGDTATVLVNCNPKGWCQDVIRIVAEKGPIDTPESRSLKKCVRDGIAGTAKCLDGKPWAGAKCVKEQKLGLIAKVAATRMLEGQTVKVVPTAALGDERNGRMIARITMQDGKDFGNEMLRLGHAQIWAEANGEFGGLKPDWCK